MTNSTEKNDKENGEETKGKLFRVGGPGGPGRGNRKPLPALTLPEIEEYLQHDLRSSDAKIRHSATKLLLAIRKMHNPDTKQGINPELMELIRAISGRLFGDNEVTEADEFNFD